MRTLTLFLIMAALVACKKKEDSKPSTPAQPAPITQANTSFRIQAGGIVHLNLIGGASGTIKNYNSSGTQRPDTTTTKSISSQTITFNLTASYPVTLTINSGHKSYTYIDTVNVGDRTISLW